jgi:peptidoglycan/LPS O-acetylase OafA/YrhL
LKKISYIDSLRGIAILMVLISHTTQSICGLPPLFYKFGEMGKYGVQLFFVMSAYTLCLSKSFRSDEHKGNLKYFIRRYFRIAPLYYIGILVYGIVFLIKNKYDINTYILNPDYSFGAVFSHFTFTHGLFPRFIHSAVLGGWSIGTEMLFYASFPFLFYFYSKIKMKKMLILIPIGVMFLVFLFFRLLPHLFPPISNHDFEFYYCSIINQIPVFLIGMSLFFYPTAFEVHKRLALFSLLMFILLIGLMIYVTRLGFNDITLYPFFAGGSFVLLFIAVKNLEFLNSKLIQMIGRLSFSMYIFHFLFAWWVSSYLNQVLASSLNSYFIYLICILTTIIGSVIIASMSKYLIEDNGIKLGSLIIKRIKNN